jgi:hypothetical protein
MGLGLRLVFHLRSEAHWMGRQIKADGRPPVEAERHAGRSLAIRVTHRTQVKVAEAGTVFAYTLCGKPISSRASGGRSGPRLRWTLGWEASTS